jgi:amino acid transporter
VPKRSVGGQADPGGDTFTRPIGTWLAAGLSLAVIGITTQLGVFTVYAAVLLTPMVYVFARLHGHAPQARTTSDLVGAVLGERFGVFAGLIQLVAYLLIGVKFAQVVAMSVLTKFLAGDSYVPIGWFTVGSIAAVAGAGIVIHLLSTRVIVWVAAILAAIGMLVYFYVAIALVALIATGSQPRDPGISMPTTPNVTYGLVDVLLGVLLVVGFEVVTTINRDVRSAGRSMGLALALTAGCALTVAAALSPRLFRSVRMPSDRPFALLVGAYLGDAGAMWVLIGNLVFGCAGLLMLTFATVRVTRRLAEQLELPLQDGARLAGIFAIVAVLLVVEWLWAGVGSAKLGDVGRLLLLAVYACAAYACARITKPEPSFGAVAACFFIAVVVAGVVVVPLRDQDAPAQWGLLLGIAAVVLVAAAIAVKTERLPRTSKAREELLE